MQTHSQFVSVNVELHAKVWGGGRGGSRNCKLIEVRNFVNSSNCPPYHRFLIIHIRS